MHIEFDHVHFRCADMGKTVAFYREVMGAEFLGEAELAGRKAVRLQLGGKNLVFFQAEPDHPGTVESAATRLGAYHLAYWVEDHDAAVSWFKSRGANFLREGIMATPELKVAFIEAPDGMQIELMQKLK